MTFLRRIVNRGVRELTAYPLATVGSILLMIGLLGGIQLAHRIGSLNLLVIVVISLIIMGIVALRVVDLELSKHF